MEKVFINIAMGMFMMGNFKKIKNMERDYWKCRMEIFTKENGTKDKEVEKANIFLPIRKFIKVISWMGWEKDMEYIVGMTILVMKVIEIVKKLGNWNKNLMHGEGLYVSHDGK